MRQVAALYTTIHIFENIPNFAPKTKFYQKKPPTKTEGYLVSLIDLKQISAAVFKDTCYVRILSITYSFYICINELRKALKL